MARSPFVLFDAGSGTGPTLDLDGRFWRLTITLKTSPDLTNNAGANLVVETSDNPAGPWTVPIAGSNPGPGDTDANTLAYAQTINGLYHLIRARVNGSFTSGSITVIAYFEPL